MLVPPSTPPPSIGQPAPAVSLAKLDGTPVQLASFNGKLTLLASSIALIAVAWSVVLVKATTAEDVPDRLRFISFPEEIGQWTARRSQLP